MSRLGKDLMKNVPTWWVMSQNITPTAWSTCCLQNHWLCLTLLLSHSLVLVNFIMHIYSIKNYALSFDLHISCQPQYIIFEVPAYIWSRWMLLTSYIIQGVYLFVVIIVKYIHMNTTPYFSLYLQLLGIADIS